MAREISEFSEGSVRVATMGMPDDFIEHGSRGELMAEMGLDATGIAARGRELAEAHGLTGTARESA